MSEMLALGLIKTDGGTQPRAILNQEVVQEYAEAIQNGDKFPELIVFYDGTVYWLVDGFHRYHAYKQIKQRKVPCLVKQGSHRDAVLASVGVNAKHGLRRTNEDKRRAVLKLLEDEEWSQNSDNWMAKTANVDPGTVKKIREHFGFLKCSTRKCSDGRTMDTTNLGRKAGSGDGEAVRSAMQEEGLKEQPKEQSIQDKIKEVNQAIKNKTVTKKELAETQKLIWSASDAEPDPEKEEETRRRVQANTPSRIARLNGKMGAIIDDLTMLADGSLEVTAEDRKWVKAIIMKGPNWILQFHKLGVDLKKVYSTLINPKQEIDYESKRKEGTEWDETSGIIDITPIQQDDDGEHLR